MSVRSRGIAILALCAAAIAVVAIALRVHSQHPPVRRVPHAQRTATSASAVRAAADFLAGLTLGRISNAGRLQRYITRWAAPTARSALLSVYANESRRIRAAFAARPRVARAAFLGYRLKAERPGGAAVTLWAVSMGGAGDSPVAVGWRTIRVELERVGQTWRVLRINETPGPSPSMPVRRFKAAAQRFKDFRVAP